MLEILKPATRCAVYILDDRLNRPAIAEPYPCGAGIPCLRHIVIGRWKLTYLEAPWG